VVNNDTDTFAGVSVNSRKGTATVYVTQRAWGSQKAEQALESIRHIAMLPRSASAVVWSLQITSAQHSARELNVAMEKATSDPSWRQLADPYLAIWYVDSAQNAIHIGMTRVTADLQKAAQNEFGDLAKLTVSARELLDNRSSQVDSPPWWGGDGIQGQGDDGRTYGCTGGFPVTYGMLTAGHCFSNGFLVSQPSASYRCMGTVTDRTNGGNNYDYELVNVAVNCNGSYVTGPGQGSVYRYGSYNRPIGGLAHSYLGDQACFDGAYTEENCTGSVSQNDVCVVDQAHGITYCHLDQAQSTNLTRLSGAGDSGGPVYEISGSKVYAQGIIEGEAPGTVGVIAYYTPMWRIIQDHGYTLVTCNC
jgi:streptogrisin C